jgi:hypothetical protein
MNESLTELNNLLTGLQQIHQDNTDLQQKNFSIICSLIGDVCGDPSFSKLSPQSQQKCNIIFKYFNTPE